MSELGVKLLLLITGLIIVLLQLKNLNSSFSKLATIGASVVLLSCTVSNITPVIEFITLISQKAEIDNTYLKIILKCIGISILGEFTCALCKDNGENSLSTNAEFICKVSILLLTLPMYSDILNLVLKLWKE